VPPAESLLIVEDDPRLSSLIGEFLEAQGFQVSCLDSGRAAVEYILASQPDLVILDLMLPVEDGLSISRRLRASGYQRPLLMLTALGEDEAQIRGFDAGADDYVSKPVRPQVLLARVRALLRRHAVLVTTELLDFGRLQMDGRRREVWLDSQPVDLTAAEFDLLWLLATHPGRVLSREEIFSALRGIEYDGQDRSVDVRISRIRPRIGDDPEHPRLIKTLRGKGYMFVPPVAGSL